MFTPLRTLFLIVLFPAFAYAQVSETDQLKQDLAAARHDTVRTRILLQLAYLLHNGQPDSAYRMAEEALDLSKKSGQVKTQAQALSGMGMSLNMMGDYHKALDLLQQSVRKSEQIDDQKSVARNLGNIAIIYYDQANYRKALDLLLQSEKLLRSPRLLKTGQDTLTLANTYQNLLGAYHAAHRLDSAEYYGRLSYQLARQKNDLDLIGYVANILANVQVEKGNNRAALDYFRQSIAILTKSEQWATLSQAYLNLSQFYRKTNRRDSSLYYAHRALDLSRKSSYLYVDLEANKYLSELYEGENNAKALHHYKAAMVAKDSLYGQEKVRRFMTVAFEEQQRRQQLQAAEEAYRQRLQTYGLLALVVFILLVALFLALTNRRQKRTNRLLNRQKEEISVQRTKAEQALEELKITQAQLIQSEKMASLGKLTKGIVDRILNPLNYINNFSLSSTGILTEVADLTQKHAAAFSGEERDDLQDGLDMLGQNLETIRRHGESTARIVTDMQKLLKTRSTELVNLSLEPFLEANLPGIFQKVMQNHPTGRAPELSVELESGPSQVTILPHEFTQVLEQLLDNAGYAVREKSRRDAGFIPQVSVQTQANGETVAIQVRDNGKGIGPKELAQLFNPFYTTKPTAEGTGLGLFMSRELIEQLGGQLTIRSQEHEFTEATIVLPVNRNNTKP